MVSPPSHIQISSSKFNKLTNSLGRDYAVAFVEYARADAPDRAIDALHDSLLHGCLLKVQRKEVGRSMPKRVHSEGQLKSATTPERPTGFNALPPLAPAPMTPGTRQTAAMVPAPSMISYQFANAAGGNLPHHLPMTPSAHRNPGFPAAQTVSPAHWGPPPMMFGQYSPSGYMPQNMYNPGVYGGYGGSVPTTPAGFSVASPYAAPGGFLAGPGFAGPGFAGPNVAGPNHAGPGFSGPGFAGPGFAGPGFAGPGLGGPGLAGPGFTGPGTSLAFHDPTGSLYYGYNSATGNPQSPGLETPTRPGVDRGMGRGQGGPENSH